MKLSEFSGTEALELWADIIDQVTMIVSDEDVKKHTTGKNVDINLACKVILKKYPKDIMEIFERMGEKNINGANIYPKLVNLVMELLVGDKASDFFKPAETEKPEDGISGSATENTEVGEK